LVRRPDGPHVKYCKREWKEEGPFFREGGLYFDKLCAAIHDFLVMMLHIEPVCLIC